MQNELMIIIKRIQSHTFFEIVAPLCRLTFLAKHLMDSKPALHFYQMLGCLLLNLGKYDHAYKLFEVARDICHDTQNLA